MFDLVLNTLLVININHLYSFMKAEFKLTNDKKTICKQPPLFQNSKCCAKIRILKFGTKNKCLIWVFWAATLKSFCHIWNQRPQICLIAKFVAKKKKSLNLEPKTPFSGIFGLKFQTNVVIFEMNLFRFA